MGPYRNVFTQDYGRPGVTGGLSAPQGYRPPQGNVIDVDAVPVQPDFGARMKAGMRNATDSLLNLAGWVRPQQGATGLARLGGMKVGPALGAGGILALLGAASEFGDTQDPAGGKGNAVDALGSLGGSLLGGAAVMIPAALAGGPVGIGTLALASLASALGGPVGKAATRGISDAVGLTYSDPRMKELNDAIKKRRAEIAMQVEEAKAMQPLLAVAKDVDFADTQRRAALQQKLIMDQNYQNALLAGLGNQSAVNSNLLAQALNV